jgi:hypothetical protein
MIGLIALSFVSISVSTLMLQFGSYLKYKNEVSAQPPVAKGTSLVYA